MGGKAPKRILAHNINCSSNCSFASLLKRFIANVLQGKAKI